MKNLKLTFVRTRSQNWKRKHKMGKVTSLLCILAIGLLTLLGTGKCYAYNQYSHEVLLELSVDHLRLFSHTRAAYYFFTGDNPAGLNIKTMPRMKECLMCPDCYSTTEPDEEVTENFLSEAKVYDAAGNPANIPPDDLATIINNIRIIYDWLPEEFKLKKAAQETLLFPDDRNRALYGILPIFPIGKLDFWGSPCQGMGQQYADYYLMADWLAHTGDFKSKEYSIYAIDYYRQDDIEKAFCMLASILQWSQHATVPFKNRRPPEFPPANVTGATDRWCKELIHGNAYLNYCDAVDDFLKLGIVPIDIPAPWEYSGTFLDAVNHAITEAGLRYQPLFEYMDGFPYPDPNHPPHPVKLLVCPPQNTSDPDNYPLVYDQAIPDAISWGAFILYNYYKKIVEPYVGPPPYPLPEKFILMDIHGLPIDKSTTLTFSTLGGGSGVREVFGNHFTYFKTWLRGDIDIQEYIDYDPLRIPPCSYEFDHATFCWKPVAVCPFFQLCAIPFPPVPHITFERNVIAHIHYATCVLPEYPEEVLKADVTGDGIIDMEDAMLTAKFALGITEPTPAQMEAADVAPPCGVIDIRDIVLMTEVALGIKDESAFICSSGESQQSQSVEATIPEVQELGSVKLDIESKDIFPGQKTTIHISAASDLTGIQIGPNGSFSFDPTVIQVRSIRGVDPYMVLASEIDNEAGKAKLMVISLGKPSRNEGIIELEVEAVGKDGDSSTLELAVDMIIDAAGNEIEAEINNGAITLGEAVELRVDSVKNVPNPVTSTDTTRFIVEGVGINDIRVEIYDLSGREVFNSDWVENSFEWHLQNDDGQVLANGVYLYVVTVRGFHREVIRNEVRKLVILR